MWVGAEQRELEFWESLSKAKAKDKDSGLEYFEEKDTRSVRERVCVGL